MSKAVTKGAHWLPRTAQYSLHGQRNGRVDTLPVEASDPLYKIADQISDGKRRIADLRSEKDELSMEVHSLRRLDQVRDRLEATRAGANPQIAQLDKRIEIIGAEIRKIQHRVGELSALLSGRREVTFEGAFVQVARAELAEDTWETISFKASLIVATAKELADGR